MRLQILCPKCSSEMQLLSIVYLKDNELWVIGGWHWLEQRLTLRETMRREKQKREEESAQMDSCLHWDWLRKKVAVVALI